METSISPLKKFHHDNEDIDDAESVFTLTENAYHQASRLDVWYTNDPAVVSRWLEDNVPQRGCSFLGFDIEAVPRGMYIRRKGLFRGPATVQLATPQSSLVVHLARGNGGRSGACAPLLESVLQDERIVKVGCGLDEDMTDLMALWKTKLDMRSRLDLNRLRSSHQSCPPGLRKLSQQILGLDLAKPKKVTISDWSQVPLSDAQIAYSARDAWVAAAIADVLASHDPECFGADALVNELSAQKSLVEIQKRVQERRHAKKVLSKRKSNRQHTTNQRSTPKAQNNTLDARMTKIENQMLAISNSLQQLLQRPISAITPSPSTSPRDQIFQQSVIKFMQDLKPQTTPTTTSEEHSGMKRKYEQAIDALTKENTGLAQENTNLRDKVEDMDLDDTTEKLKKENQYLREETKALLRELCELKKALEDIKRNLHDMQSKAAQSPPRKQGRNNPKTP